MEGPGQVARVRVEHGCVREGSQLLSLIRYYESSLDWPPPSNDRDVAVERCRITSTKVRMFYFQGWPRALINIKMGHGVGIRLV